MKVRYFANIYRPMIGACGHVYASEELADQMAGRDRIACVEFEFELPEDGGTNADNEQNSE